MNKICTKCKKEKSLENFYIRRGNQTHSWCKECNFKDVLDRQQKFKKLMVEYKGGKCNDCDLVDDPRIYDFHHNDPEEKDFTISESSRTKWSEDIQKELDKCILLCANCHRRRHFKILIKE